MKKALVIGINNYPSLSSLYSCINDAEAICEILSTHEDGSPNFTVQLETTVFSKSVLRGMIINFFASESDTALFYFSGHGFINELGGCIVTSDYKKYDEGISMDELLNIANISKTKNKIIILDCCYSGAMGTPSFFGNGASYLNNGVSILTACRETEPAVEMNSHGIFTNLLLDALRGGAADIGGNITTGSVYSYVDRSLGPLDQRPVFKTNISQFVSLRSARPQISMEIMRKITNYFLDIKDQFKLDPTYEYTHPTAIDKNVAVFKDLQKFQSMGLVMPVDEEFMYWAAMNFKTCKLTALGRHYWQLVKNKRI